jgi:hypothetical protein
MLYPRRYKQNLTHPVNHAERGKPEYLSDISRVGLLQNKLTDMQVKEDGKSECLSVMERIKVNTLL